MEFTDRNCREFMEQLPEAVFLESLEGEILDVNKEACSLLGYSKEELLDMEVEDLVPEGAPAFLPDEIDNATRSGEPLETTNLHKDGTEIPAELRGRIVDIEGESRMLVSVRDITERVKARQELEEANEKLSESKERYQSYFEELGDAVFITKSGGEDHGRILEINKAAEDQTGYSEEELIGMNIEEDIAVGTPETIDYKTGDEKIQQGETVTLIEKKRRKDGTEYWTEVLVTPIEYRGETASLSINRDVTERVRVKNQLEQYKMAVEGSEDLMAVCDKNYNYVFANPAYRSFYDIGEDDMGNYKLDDLISNDSFENEVKPRVERCLQGERIEYEMERPHPTKGLRQLRIIYYPLKGEEEIHGVVAVMRDVTERKKAEQALNEERVKLKNLHDAVDHLQQQDSEEDVLETGVAVAEDILGFEICGIMLLQGDQLVSEALSPGVNFKEPISFPKEEGVAGETLQGGETVWLDDVREFKKAKSPADRFRAIISSPIGDIGVLQIISEEIAGFSEQDVEMVEILAGHLREELERVRLEKELRQQAIHDPLTGLYNRRHFNVTLDKEIEKCERYGHNIAFIMIDVNRFKEINDRYTHQTGDKVLQEVADLLQDNVRDADTVVRYGGDEFLVVMPETNGDSRYTADRLRDELSRWNDGSNLLDFPLTLAMGVSHWNPDQDRSVEDALKEADRKMYEEKD